MDKTTKALGCNKNINPHRTCGDVSFNNKIILCEDCHNKAKARIKKAVRKKWEAEREHCDNCEVGYRCDTCKPEFDKLNEEINIRDVLEDMEA